MCPVRGAVGGVVLSILFAVLAAFSNALASALQRKAARNEPAEENLSPRLVWRLLHQPVWLAGILSITVSFLLQATALGTGQISMVQPLLSLELPVALILSGFFFGNRLGIREWGASAVMAAGLAGLLIALDPRGGRSASVTWVGWLIGCGANAVLIAAGLLWARGASGTRRAALLGATTGCAFGMTAGLMKGMTNTFAHGLLALFTSWQLWAMCAAGAGAMFLLQSTLHAGQLLVTQPGLTMADPVVSILWGVLIFGESVRGSLFIVLALASSTAVAAAVMVLSRSPLLAGDAGHREEADDPDDVDKARGGDTSAAGNG